MLAHPCAHHQVLGDDIVEELHQTFRRAGRFDEAIEAKREAIAAGYRSVPDPEADIAECLVAAGRRDEADALFAELRQRDPEDVWLYNSAAWAYADVDPAAALTWSLDGIDVALATGDPDQVVMQLFEHAEASWETLGQAPDEQLVARVEAFCEQCEPVPTARRWGEVEPYEERACGHCGYDPERPRPSTTSSPDDGDAPCSRPSNLKRWRDWMPPSAGPNRPRSSLAPWSCPWRGRPPTSGRPPPRAGPTFSTGYRPSTPTTATPPRPASSASPDTSPATPSAAPR